MYHVRWFVSTTVGGQKTISLFFAYDRDLAQEGLERQGAAVYFGRGDPSGYGVANVLDGVGFCFALRDASRKARHLGCPAVIFKIGAENDLSHLVHNIHDPRQDIVPMWRTAQTARYPRKFRYIRGMLTRPPPSIGAVPEAEESLALPLDAFIRTVSVNRSSPHALFVGAGASITSGVPSAWTCMWRWKRDIFLTNNPGLEPQFRDMSQPSVQERIQRWLDSVGGYPKTGSAEEYGFYAEACYPVSESRRQFFSEMTRGAKPHVGYQLTCLLAESEIIKSVWTTNFDGMTGRAAAATSLMPIEVGLDTTHRSVRQPKQGELLTVAIHGDYRYDALLNTDAEVRRQDAQLREAMTHWFADASVIVTGYSGRDAEVMESFHRAYSHQGTGWLFWCGFDAAEPIGPVRELLALARRNGRHAYYVPTHGFDDTLVRLALHCLEGPSLERARAIGAAHMSSGEAATPPFSTGGGSVTKLIKSNAFPLTCPSELIQLEVALEEGKPVRAQIASLIGDREIVAAPFRGKLLAIGTVDEIKAAFDGRLQGAIERTPIGEHELTLEDGVVVSLLSSALVRGLASRLRLSTDGRNRIWRPEPRQSPMAIGDCRCTAHDAVIVFIRSFRGRQYLVVKPTVKALLMSGDDAEIKVEQEVKRRILTRQYNTQFNDSLNTWRRLLFSNGSNSVEFPVGVASPFRFRVGSSPTFAAIASTALGGLPEIPPAEQASSDHKGVEFREPRLLFSAVGGSIVAAADSHPLRGIVSNRPYDFPLTTSGIQRQIRVGVVGPKADERRVLTYLQALEQPHRPSTKDEYLVDYPGFSRVFGLPVELPRGRGWVDVVEPSAGTPVQEGARLLTASVLRAIDSLVASAEANVVLIYIPRRWRSWEKYETEHESFDLHDYVKAYSAQRGIATQFVREDTLFKPQQCEIMWWLGLSLYAKSMRTPWVLEGLDPGTAFVGIGFSTDANARRGEHIVIGCSHIYTAEGVGLRYRLSKIENPTWRGKNPFMSLDDARRLGGTIRQLFYEAAMRLPQRVVIHKRTPFLRDEQQGLREGLEGVAAIDMLEINVDPAVRYVASRFAGGKFADSMFPVSRGTAVVVENRKALLWVHGAAPGIRPGRTYYMGASRIPAPLVIKRHFGQSSLETVATEILGLSKMGWNSFDLYQKMPATLQSSSQIARIGSLLQRFSNQSYDYRLFI